VTQRKCIDLENEIRGLLKVFVVKLPMRLSRGAFDVAVRDTIESDPALSRALLQMLHARQMLFEQRYQLFGRNSRIWWALAKRAWHVAHVRSGLMTLTQRNLP